MKSMNSVTLLQFLSVIFPANGMISAMYFFNHTGRTKIDGGGVGGSPLAVSEQNWKNDPLSTSAFYGTRPWN